MITLEDYIKLILTKRGMTQADLLRVMQEKKLGKVDKCHLNNFIKGTGPRSFLWAKRIEIALDLEKDSIVKMIGKPTDYEIVKMEDLEVE